MTMTKELIDRLRTNANWLDEEDNDERAIRKSMLEAADTIQFLSEKINALQTEPCEDCISRQAVLDELERCHITSGVKNQGTWNECVDSIIRTIGSMPSVQPEQVGHWIEQEGYYGDVYYDCSACGNSWTTIDGTPWDNGMNYCPCCGAKMEEGE